MDTLSKSETYTILKVFRMKDVWNLIMKFIPELSRPNRNLVLAVLGDVWWLRKSIRNGTIRFYEKPVISCKFAQKIIEEEWFDANILLNEGKVDELATAITKSKIIYANKSLMSCAAQYKRANFINWALANKKSRYDKVVII